MRGRAFSGAQRMSTSHSNPIWRRTLTSLSLAGAVAGCATIEDLSEVDTTGKQTE